MDGTANITPIASYVRQLKNIIIETEKAISFKSGLLKWALKANNISMALNLSQYIILKTDELETLHFVQPHLANLNATQRQHKDQIYRLLKSALILIEDCPTNSSYAALKQLAAILSGENLPKCENIRLRVISKEEQTNFIKSFIDRECSEINIPKEMEAIFSGEFEDPTKLVNLPENRGIRHSRGDTTREQSIEIEQNNVVETAEVYQTNTALSGDIETENITKRDPLIEDLPNLSYYSTQFQSLQMTENSQISIQPFEKPLEEDSQTVSSIPKTKEGETRERENMPKKASHKGIFTRSMTEPERSEGVARSQSIENPKNQELLGAGRRSFDLLDKMSIYVEPDLSLVNERKKLRNSVESVKKSFSNCKIFQRSTEDVAPHHCLMSPNVPLNETDKIPTEEDLVFEEPAPIGDIYPLERKVGQLSHESAPHSPTKKEHFTTLISPRILEEVTWPTHAETKLHRRDSINSSSSCDHFEADIQEIKISDHLNSPVENPTIEAFQIPVLLQDAPDFCIKDPQSEVESMIVDQFPPIKVLDELQQRDNENAQNWIARIEGHLMYYMRPSCYEYDVILRWLLSRGSKHRERRPAPVSFSLHDILMELPPDGNVPSPENSNTWNVL